MFYSVLQGVIACFSVLYCAAVCCSVPLCVAGCCSVLQRFAVCVAACCSVLRCIAYVGFSSRGYVVGSLFSTDINMNNYEIKKKIIFSCSTAVLYNYV